MTPRVPTEPWLLWLGAALPIAGFALGAQAANSGKFLPGILLVVTATLGFQFWLARQSKSVPQEAK